MKQQNAFWRSHLVRDDDLVLVLEVRWLEQVELKRALLLLRTALSDEDEARVALPFLWFPDGFF